MIEEFMADCGRYNGNQRATLWRALGHIRRNQGLQALLGYRLGRAARELKTYKLLPLVPIYWLGHVIITGYVRLAYDIRLSLTADIGGGLHIVHFGGISIANCKIGRHCSLGQSTRVGADAGAGPTIGDYVWLGPHSEVVGAYRIGAGSTLSAGAVVKRDIPELALAIGSPARVVMMSYDNSAMLGLPDMTVKLRLLSTNSSAGND